MVEARRTVVAAGMAVLLVATAIVSLWLMASAGVLGADGSPLQGAPGFGALDSASGLAPPSGGRVQINQPRDPFAPLVTVTTEPGGTTVPGETTTTAPGGETTTTAPGDTTTTTAGDGTTTTTTPGDEPDAVRIALLEIRDEAGERVAVLTVDGETYTVGVGDEFADDFKVVSLAESSGIFQYGDRVFSLAVGQSILK
jgi:hypothetical protein